MLLLQCLLFLFQVIQQTFQRVTKLQITKTWRVRRRDIDHHIISSAINLFHTNQIIIDRFFDWRIKVLTNVNTQYAIKIAPDLSSSDIEALADTFKQYELDGIIATNTTFDRSKVEGMKHAEEQGGLSGKPLASQSTKVIKRLVEALDDSIPVIGVGGITDEQSAIDKIEAGAKLVQIYSGFIYHGPQLVYEVAKALKEHQQS